MRNEYKFRDNYIEQYKPDLKSQKDFEMLGTAEIIPFTNKKLRLKPGGPKDMFGEEIEGADIKKIKQIQRDEELGFDTMRQVEVDETKGHSRMYNPIYRLKNLKRQRRLLNDRSPLYYALV